MNTTRKLVWKSGGCLYCESSHWPAQNCVSCTDPITCLLTLIFDPCFFNQKFIFFTYFHKKNMFLVFTAIARQTSGKKLSSSVWHCTLNTVSSSSGVRHWSSPCLVFLARLWQAHTVLMLTVVLSPWPLSLQVGERGKLPRTATVCSQNLLHRDRQCLVSLLVICWSWTTYAVDPHSMFSCFTFPFLWFPLSLILFECFAQTKALMGQYLKDVC